MKTDYQLQRDVLDELKWEPSVDAADVGVAVKNGVVTLTGHVSSYAEKYAAETKRVYGVKAVANELDVKLHGSSKRTDEDIAIAVVKALQTSVSVPADKIKVVVNSGWVTLDGEVEWYYQKDAAEWAVRYLTGVIGVTNLIKVKPHAPLTDVKSRIEEALKRHAEKDAEGITVDVDGGKVVLRGTVHSWAEKEEAARGLVGAGSLRGRKPAHDRGLTGRSEWCAICPRRACHSTDEELALAAVEALESKLFVPADKWALTPRLRRHGADPPADICESSAAASVC